METRTHLKVLFWGNYIPLQGVDTIVRAAALLHNRRSSVHIDLIGDGQTWPQVQALATTLSIPNVTFFGRQPLVDLPARMRTADVCLGIFGATDKAQRVIPNKLYAAVAMAKPVITADTPAVRELFTNRQDVLLCRSGSPEDLADKIEMLHHDSKLRYHIAEGGYHTYQARCTPNIIGATLLADLRSL